MISLSLMIRLISEISKELTHTVHVDGKPLFELPQARGSFCANDLLSLRMRESLR